MGFLSEVAKNTSPCHQVLGVVSQNAVEYVGHLGQRPMTLQVAPEGLPPAGAPDSTSANPPSSDAEARGDPITAEHGETPALVERRHARARDELGNLFSDDSDSSTTGSMSDTPAPVADTPPDSDATLSDEDGWMPQLGHNEPPVPRDDSMPAMLPAERAPEAAALSGEESEGTISESSLPALVPVDSSDDDLLFDHPPADHSHQAGDEECVLGMACASCGTPVVMASELLTEQTARLERKVYPYELTPTPSLTLALTLAQTLALPLPLTPTPTPNQGVPVRARLSRR